MQSELAQTVVEQLRGQLGGGLDASTKAELKAQVAAAGRGGTKNADAYQLYLQGTFFLNQFSLDTAVRAADFLQRAVERDPNFALAWAALSRAGSVRGGYAATKRDVDEGFALARRAADRALKLQPELAAAHLARLIVQMWYDFDWKGAAESLRRAEKVAATDPDVLAAAANVAYTFGQTEKAVELAGQAVSLDPVECRNADRAGLCAGGRRPLRGRNCGVPASHRIEPNHGLGVRRRGHDVVAPGAFRRGAARGGAGIERVVATVCAGAGAVGDEEEGRGRRRVGAPHRRLRGHRGVSRSRRFMRTGARTIGPSSGSSAPTASAMPVSPGRAPTARSRGSMTTRVGRRS